MNQIKWNKDWILDYDGIDTQHKQLIRIVNKVIRGKADAVSLVEQLIDYTSIHFMDEERLMIDNKYPHDLYTAHKKEHKEFINLLLETSFGLIKNGDPELASKIKEFVLDWFKYHFLGTDKKLADFLKGGANKPDEPNK
jgi:hemerythrin